MRPLASALVAIALAIGSGLIATPASASPGENFVEATPREAYANQKVTLYCSEEGNADEDTSATIRAGNGEVLAFTRANTRSEAYAYVSPETANSAICELRRQDFLIPRYPANPDRFPTVRVRPYPVPTVDCRVSPSAPYEGDPITVSGSITNRSSFTTSDVTVTASDGASVTSPLIASGTMSFTCSGTGVVAATAPGSTDHTSAAVTRTVTVTARALPEAASISATPSFGALMLQADGTPAQQVSLTTAPSPSGWRYQWSTSGGFKDSPPSSVPCGVTTPVTPALVRDGVVNQNVITGSPVSITPPCAVPTPQITSAFIANGALTVNYTFPSGAPEGLRLQATYATDPRGPSGQGMPIGSASPEGGSIMVTAGIGAATSATVSLTASLGPVSSAESSTAVAVAEPPTVSYPPISGTEGKEISPVRPRPSGVAKDAETAGYAYAWSAGTGRPAGLRLDPDTGEISGTPETGVTGVFTIDITHPSRPSKYPAAVATVDVSIVPAPVDAGEFDYPSIVSVAGEPLDRVVPRRSALSAVYFSSPDLCDRFPGLDLDPRSGAITGTPSEVGRGTARVVATAAGPGGCGPVVGQVLTEASVSLRVTAPLWTVAYPSVSGVVGSPLSADPLIEGAGPTAELSFSISPDLPAGLSLNPETGELSGTPTTALEPRTFVVTGQRTAPGLPDTTATATFTVAVAPRPAVVTPSYPTVASPIGQPQVVFPSSVEGWQGFALDPGAPEGLVIDAQDGAVTWAARAGTWSIGVSAVDEAGERVNLGAFQWTALPAPAAMAMSPAAIERASSSASSSAPRGATRGMSTGDETVRCPATLPMLYSDIQAHAGSTLVVTPNVTMAPAGASYTVTDGSLPSGLHLDRGTGIISGTPARENGGAVPVEITAVGQDGMMVMAQFTIDVDAPHLSVNYPLAVDAESGSPTTITPMAGNADPDVQFAIVCGSLPSGLTLDARTGVVSGTPSEDSPASTLVHVQARDSYGATEASWLLNIRSMPTVSLTYPADTVVGTGASVALEPTTTGLPPTTRYRLDGTLPKGLVLDPTTGAIRGRVTAAPRARMFEAMVTALDASGSPVATTSVSFTVSRPVTPLRVTTGTAQALRTNTATTVVRAIRTPGWAERSISVTCVGAPCSWKETKGTGAVTVRPGKSTRSVRVVVIATPKDARAGKLMAPHTWTHTWSVTQA